MSLHLSSCLKTQPSFKRLRLKSYVCCPFKCHISTWRPTQWALGGMILQVLVFHELVHQRRFFLRCSWKVRLKCHGFCLSQLFRENGYKPNYEETPNYLTLFISSSFTMDKARFLQPSKKTPNSSELSFSQPSLDLSQMKLNQVMVASAQHQPKKS